MGDYWYQLTQETHLRKYRDIDGCSDTLASVLSMNKNQELRAITHEAQVRCITEASSMLASDPFSAAHA